MRCLPSKGWERPRKPKYKFEGGDTPYILYLKWMVAMYGAKAVGDMQEPPITFEEWQRVRGLARYTTK